MGWVVAAIILVVVIILAVVVVGVRLDNKKKEMEIQRGVRMVALLIHLPPSTDDIQGGGRDERDVVNETVSQAQTMYAILASTAQKGRKVNLFGQEHMSFEITAKDGRVNYYAIVPAEQVEIAKQAIISAYPTARVEETKRENIFSEKNGIIGVAGTELRLKKEYIYPINTYEESKRDASAAILNAMSATKEGEGLVVQILIRPAGNGWIKKAIERTQNLKNGHKTTKNVYTDGSFIQDLIMAPIRPPEVHEKHETETMKPLTNLEQEEIAAIENKTKYPAFETLIRVVASAESSMRAEAMMGGVVTAFSQFDSVANNGFKFDAVKDTRKVVRDFVLRAFSLRERGSILNSVELASIFHLPQQNVIATSQVERQNFKQVDGPAKLVKEGVLLGVNEFRGEQKEIRLSDNDRRRHTYIIGSTGMGKSVLLKNIAYQDMLAGRGFAFIDPHGDAVEDLLAMVPPERMEDVIYFNPSDLENPIGMNMFEYKTDDEKDFIVQEGINMLTSLYDPNNQGYFGARGQHMFRNAALLLMSDPKGATFIDIPKCFIDPQFVKEKLKYVTDRDVYEYWTKEFPQSQRSSDAGEVTTWFASKWGPFLSNTMMKNILGQTKSGFDIREIMDGKKIFLVNLSKGKMGELNSRLLGMILVMKFQMAAMSRADIPEEARKDFCLFVDEFQNFSTESFESILSEARKYRLNLIVANQFLTQLTDKIREGILGNVGTIIAGRLGVTDAEMLQKTFAPTFGAEDLHKLPNYHAITTVMMFDMPTAPFTMKLLPPMGEKKTEVLENLRQYSAMKYGRDRGEVEQEIARRHSTGRKEEKAVIAEKSENEAQGGSQGANTANFLAGWEKKREEIGGNGD